MGCDIHFYTETRDAAGVWRCVDRFAEPDQDGYVACISPALYHGRNYNLFGMLADVRNGRGFAGIKTGAGFQPIAEPRGLPEDVSETVRKISDGWGTDGHSHSHHTLRQLLDYDWTQSTALQGWCNFEQWFEWKRWRDGEGLGPESYCGGVSGATIRHLSASDMNLLCAQYRMMPMNSPERAAFKTEHAKDFALAEWRNPYYVAAGSFISDTIPRLLALAGGVAGVDNVRIVFFFDN